MSVDPLASKYPSLSPYNYVSNNPLILVDPDGRGINFTNIPGRKSLENAYNKFRGAVSDVVNNLKESDNVIANVVGDAINRLVPQTVDEAAVQIQVAGLGTTAGMMGASMISASDAKKTYQTYTKTNPESGEVYSGRTSGTGTPAENVANRDKTHHRNDEGFGPAKLDQTSSNKDAIRGREQQLIEQHGGAKSQNGTSGNKINSVSPNNPKKKVYEEAAKKEFGDN